MTRLLSIIALAINAAIILGCALLLLSGCAAEPFWHTDMPGYAAPVSVIRVRSAEHLAIACGTPRPADGACSRRYPQECMVYLGPRADACAESHEVNGHCKGRNHKRLYGIVQECAYDG